MMVHVIIYPVNVHVHPVGRVHCVRNHVQTVSMALNVNKNVNARITVIVIHKVVNVIVQLVGRVMCVLIDVQIIFMDQIVKIIVNALMVHIVIMLPVIVNVHPVLQVQNVWIRVQIICMASIVRKRANVKMVQNVMEQRAVVIVQMDGRAADAMNVFAMKICMAKIVIVHVNVKQKIQKYVIHGRENVNANQDGVVAYVIVRVHF